MLNMAHAGQLDPQVDRFLSIVRRADPPAVRRWTTLYRHLHRADAAHAERSAGSLPKCSALTTRCDALKQARSSRSMARGS